MPVANHVIRGPVLTQQQQIYFIKPISSKLYQSYQNTPRARACKTVHEQNLFLSKNYAGASRTHRNSNSAYIFSLGALCRYQSDASLEMQSARKLFIFVGSTLGLHNIASLTFLCRTMKQNGTYPKLWSFVGTTVRLKTWGVKIKLELCALRYYLNKLPSLETLQRIMLGKT